MVGIMTKAVRKRARLTTTELGGVCCRPMAVRRNDSTITNRVNEVMITRIDGARVRMVMRERRWMKRQVVVAAVSAPRWKVNAGDRAGQGPRSSDRKRTD